MYYDKHKLMTTLIVDITAEDLIKNDSILLVFLHSTVRKTDVQ